MSDDNKAIVGALAKALMGCPVYFARDSEGRTVVEGKAVAEYLAPQVLAAIRAAADRTMADFSDDTAPLNDAEFKAVLDAALAAMTDHPGGDRE